MRVGSYALDRPKATAAAVSARLGDHRTRCDAILPASA